MISVYLHPTTHPNLLWMSVCFLFLNADVQNDMDIWSQTSFIIHVPGFGSIN